MAVRIGAVCFVHFLRAMPLDCRHNVRGRHWIWVEGSVKFVERGSSCAAASWITEHFATRAKQILLKVLKPKLLRFVIMIYGIGEHIFLLFAETQAAADSESAPEWTWSPASSENKRIFSSRLRWLIELMCRTVSYLLLRAFSRVWFLLHLRLKLETPLSRLRARHGVNVTQLARILTISELKHSSGGWSGAGLRASDVTWHEMSCNCHLTFLIDCIPRKISSELMVTSTSAVLLAITPQPNWKPNSTASRRSDLRVDIETLICKL